ncbi:aldo/keto reductase [Actinomycetaceae bacterium L2_0104]
MNDLTTASDSVAETETDETADIPTDSKLAPPRPDGNRPRLLYGCMGLGGSWTDPDYTPADIDTAWEALHAAASIGITELDLADIYTSGKSERIVGEVLSRDPDLRAHFSIQTKCGILLPLEGAVTRYDLSPAYIASALEASLERLGVDHIDTLLLHRPDPLMNPTDTVRALDSALEEGKIRHWGVSNMGPYQMDSLAGGSERLRVDQLELSLGARRFVESAMNVKSSARAGSAYPDGTVEYCLNRGIEVQAWSPLAQGRYTASPSSPIAKNRTQDEAATARFIGDLAKARGTTRETVALWWLTMHPAGIRPVIGTTNPQRIGACEDANRLDSRLSREDWYTLLTLARGENCP